MPQAKKPADSTDSTNRVQEQKVQEQLDAPRLPDENPPATADVVDAQVRPMDEQEAPHEPAIGVVPNEGPVFMLRADMPGVLKAEDIELDEWPRDPTLITIPGLGQFRNGESTALSPEQVYLWTQHLAAAGITEPAKLPAGVTIEEVK